MILNYLLAFSVLITSVIKTADVFKKSNSDLDKTRKSFIAATRKKHDRGSLSLSGALFTVMFSLLLLFFTLKFRTELNEARYRRDSYLCMNYLNIKTENYIFDMTALNWLLRSSAVAAFSIIASAEAIEAHKALEVARDARHLYYLKELAGYPYCAKEMIVPAFLKLPYKTRAGLKLETNSDGTTLLREEKWTRTLFKHPAGIRFKNSFCLQSEFQMEGVMIPKLKVMTSESMNGGISKLKCLSGFQ